VIAPAPPAANILRPPEARVVVLHGRVVAGAGGGPESSVLRSPALLEATPYWAAAAYLHPPGDPGIALLRRRADARRCPLVTFADRGPFDLRPLRELLVLCRRLGVRIWHGHDYKTNLFGLLLNRRHPMALVSTAHGWVTRTRRTPLYYAIDRLCLRRYQHVITVAPDLHAAVRDLGVPPARCSLIPNAVDSDEFRRRVPPARAALRRRRGTPAGRRVIGAVGRLQPEKHFPSLIEATDTLRRGGLDVELWIAGDGPERARLQEFIDRLGVGDRVALVGTVEDIATLYAAVDVFALSSVREALPNALLEAMAMELPVVAAAVGAVPSVIRDGVNGLLYRSGDTAALQGALRRVLEDPALAARTAHAARQTVERDFTFAARSAGERAVYDAVLQD
jgi:glycosyltransferase involved in cell wall biosynthesis